MPEKKMDNVPATRGFWDIVTDFSKLPALLVSLIIFIGVLWLLLFIILPSSFSKFIIKLNADSITLKQDGLKINFGNNTWINYQNICANVFANKSKIILDGKPAKYTITSSGYVSTCSHIPPKSINNKIKKAFIDYSQNTNNKLRSDIFKDTIFQSLFSNILIQSFNAQNNICWKNPDGQIIHKGYLPTIEDTFDMSYQRADPHSPYGALLGCFFREKPITNSSKEIISDPSKEIEELGSIVFSKQKNSNSKILYIGSYCTMSIEKTNSDSMSVNVTYNCINKKAEITVPNKSILYLFVNDCSPLGIPTDTNKYSENLFDQAIKTDSLFYDLYYYDNSGFFNVVIKKGGNGNDENE
jgi:hypothetical protein